MRKDNSFLTKFKQNLLKNELLLEHGDAVPLFFEMTALGFTNNLYNSGFFSYKYGVSFFKDKEVDYISLVKEHKKIGKNVLNKYIENKDFFIKLYVTWKKNFMKLKKNYYQLFLKDFSKLSDSELITVNNSIYNLFKNKVSMPGFNDGFMFYADEEFVRLVNKFCKKNSISDSIKIYSSLSNNTSISFIRERELELYSIYLKYMPSEFLIKDFKFFLKNNKNFRKEIDDHILKYSYSYSSYAGYVPYSLDIIQSEISNYILGKHIPSEEGLSEILILDNISFTKEIIAFKELLNTLTKWQDLRKEYTLMYVTLKSKIVQEMCSRRKNISYDQLIYTFNEELISCFLSDSISNDIKNRKEGVFFFCQNNELVCSLDISSSYDLIEKILDTQKISEQKEIKGVCASKGKVQGRVRIVRSAKNIDSVKDGEILVAPMTRPEFLVGLRRASGIITDDGGLTCHAAIVAREMKKPCVVGTKLATKLLKDGDLVELDADNGIIKLF